MCVCVSKGDCRGQEMVSEPLGLELWVEMICQAWVLWAMLRPFERVVCTLNHGAISPFSAKLFTCQNIRKTENLYLWDVKHVIEKGRSPSPWGSWVRPVPKKHMMALPVSLPPQIGNKNLLWTKVPGLKNKALGRAAVLVSYLVRKSLPRSGKMTFSPVCAEVWLPGLDVLLQNGTSQENKRPKATRKARKWLCEC